MSNFNNQWIEIFQAGDYGEKGDWPAERLHEVVRNHNSETWQAPAVLGHPTDDAPAYAWVSELREESGRLMARFRDVHPALETLVADRRYPNRSAAFYLDPEGKGPVLRHVGFLGGHPPEVKGLAPIHFSESDFVAFDFPTKSDAHQEETRRTVLGVLREFFGGRVPQSEPVAVFTEKQVTERVAAVVGPLEEKLEALAADIQSTERNLTERKKELDTRERQAQVTVFVEKQRAANRWVPAFDEAGLPEVLEHLAASSTTVEFREGSKSVEVSPYDLLVRFLERVPQIVPTRELARAARKAGRLIQFTEPTASGGAAIDPASVTLAERVEALKAEVRKENPQADTTRIHQLALDRARHEGTAEAVLAAGKI